MRLCSAGDQGGCCAASHSHLQGSEGQLLCWAQEAGAAAGAGARVSGDGLPLSHAHHQPHLFTPCFMARNP